MGGVYKLAELEGRPLLKRSEDPGKSTLPGRKIVQRGMDADGRFLQDVISLVGEEPMPGDTVYDPANPLRQVTLPAGARWNPRERHVMENGVRCGVEESLEEMADRSLRQVALLPEGCERLTNPHRYKVSVSKRLLTLREELLAQINSTLSPSPTIP